jgi:RND family efflux transporter MFP subunit
MNITRAIEAAHGKRLVLLLCVTSLGLVECSRTPPPATLQTVSAGTVQLYAPEAEQRYMTSILPNARVDLAFKSPGVVGRIMQIRGGDGRVRPVGIGDKVSAGTELARVRTADYEQRVRQLQAVVEQAKAHLQSAKAMEAEAQSNFERASTLYQTASISKPNYEHAVEQKDSAGASVQAAQAALVNGESVLEEARFALNDTALRAPFDGWIVARDIEVGMLVGNTVRAFSMVDIHLVKATYSVPDNALQEIRLGQPQRLVLDTLHEPLQGVVTAISQVADPRSRLFSVEVTVPNPADQIRPGMVGTLTVGQAQAGAPRLVVPLAALVKSKDTSDGFAVWILEDRGGKTYVRNQIVRIGETYGSLIEVLSGLTAGQRVAASGGPFLTDGQEVRVLP